MSLHRYYCARQLWIVSAYVCLRMCALCFSMHRLTDVVLVCSVCLYLELCGSREVLIFLPSSVLVISHEVDSYRRGTMLLVQFLFGFYRLLRPLSSKISERRDPIMSCFQMIVSLL